MNERDQLRTIVRGAYDVQKLRIQMGNRIVGNFKAKLGQEPGEKEETIDEKGKDILANLRAAFKKLTDGVATFPRRASFKGGEVISTYTELCLIAQYFELEKAETDHFKRLGSILKDYAIWNDFLDGVKGVGPAMGGVIVSEFDIHKARYPSSLWAYAGLDVGPDGMGRSKKKEHLRKVEYKDRDGKPAVRDGITFNPFLKTKLVGVLASSFLKALSWSAVDAETWEFTPEDHRRLKIDKKTGEEIKQAITDESPYRKVYYDYKHRLESHAKWGAHRDEEKNDKGHKVTSKGRRHNMAMRYMIKMFLIDLYKAWRALENLPVSPPYHEAKLGHKHGAQAVA